MSRPQVRERSPGIDRAPRLALAAGIAVCILLLALVVLAVVALMDEVHLFADRIANEASPRVVSLDPMMPPVEKRLIDGV